MRHSRTVVDDDLTAVAATCGCRGRRLRTRGGAHPVVDVQITEPCPDGHPGRVAAGVLERFLPGQVHTL